MNLTQNVGVNQFYDGSQVLWSLTDVTGLPIDQINFLASQFIALVLGYVYREYAGPDKASANQRHLIQVLIGIPLTYFCFGRQILHLITQSIICFLLLRFLEPGIMEKAVFMAAMAYLCICHIYRTIYDYGGYTLDITGPLMLNTQRLSSLAFGLRDGQQREDETSSLSPNMRHQAVRSFPSLLEYSSYVFSFHGIMCGPFCFYNDYVAFINGTNFSSSQSQIQNHNNKDHLQSSLNVTHEFQVVNQCNSRYKELRKYIGLERALCNKLLTALVFGLSTIFLLPRFPKSILTGPEFTHHGFFYKMFLIIWFASLQRQKYYFAWKLGEAVNTSAGLGFNGYDDRGDARWDLIDNADIWKVEFSTSLKELLDYWNRSTMFWLRYVIYERTKSTVAVFLFSAFWHGFYAGYYMTFCTGGMLIHTARLVRRNVRPFFQSNHILVFLYDAITFLATRIAIAYLGFPFLVLEFWPIINIYRGVYWWMHGAAFVMAILVLATTSSSSSSSGFKKK